MPTNEETLKAALAVARNFVQAQSGGEWDEEIIERDAQELSVAIAAFAESEISRAVKECIEELAKMACEDCEGGVVPATRVENDYPERWYHVVEGDDVHAENVYICAADDIREHAHLLYQRDLASKGEES